MTILFDATRTVKPARPFGKGILASLPTYSAPYSQADLDWLAADDEARELDRRVDAMFEESEAIDRLERGLCC